MIYQATYQKAVESNNIGFLLVTIVALVTSTLALASFVKVTQSVFFGQIRPEHEDVKEVPAGKECGMSIAGFNDIKEGDFIEAFKIVEIKRTL
jgi:formate hydrogenlyase subunit 3/multisubunit Na+/H+ antiporter MnhD subunit